MDIDEKIKQVCDEIAQHYAPEQIILFNYKNSVLGEPRSFKLCVVTKTDNKSALEKEIYLNVECDIPFDILIYTSDEWEHLTAEATSFAYRIKKKGTVVYGKAL